MARNPGLLSVLVIVGNPFRQSMKVWPEPVVGARLAGNDVVALFFVENLCFGWIWQCGHVGWRKYGDWGMRVFIGFDDTDVVGVASGTGKFARRFGKRLPEGTSLYGIVRQQLPVLEGIPYTSRNSSACLIVDDVEPSDMKEIIDRAVEHIREHFIDGSDPGLCVVQADGTSTEALAIFGRLASSRVVGQREAMQAVNGFHLSGHGGTNDGIIGAAAGVGLTLSGWSGRFIEYNDLRRLPRKVKVADLEARGVRVLSIDRNGLAIGPDETVDTRDWLRPRLWAGEAVLPVESCGQDCWCVIGCKSRNMSLPSGAE